MEPDQTANGLWRAIADHFQANQAPRAIFLSQAFHSMTQGDRKIEDYGNEMKKVADALRDVGQVVSPSTLLLNLLRGLNSRYNTTADIIAGTAGMTFATALDQLKLKELRLENEAKVEATNALVASSSSGCSGTDCRPPSRPQQPLPPQQQPQQGAGGSTGGQQQHGGQRRKRNNDQRSNGGGSGQQQQPRALFPAGPWICINPHAFQRAQGFGGGGTGQWRGGQGLLGSHPQANAAYGSPCHTSASSWDTAGLVAAIQQMALQGDAWVMDTDASTHMHSSDGILLSHLPAAHSSITVGNGARIPVTSRGSSILKTDMSNFILNNILVAPSLVHNLLSVRQFTRDNSCSIEFDASGFSVKEPRTGRVILRCDSTSDLYTIPSAAPALAQALLATSAFLWHRPLGHPGPAIIASLRRNNLISCNKPDHSLCHACQLGKYVRLPFSTSMSKTVSPFEIVHCDVWTSPIPSLSG
jgi:hypothetical protein